MDAGKNGSDIHKSFFLPVLTSEYRDAGYNEPKVTFEPRNLHVHVHVYTYTSPLYTCILLLHVYYVWTKCTAHVYTIILMTHSTF